MSEERRERKRDDRRNFHCGCRTCKGISGMPGIKAKNKNRLAHICV